MNFTDESDARTLLVTGANGFVGHALCYESFARGYEVKAITRNRCVFPLGIQNNVVGDLNGNTNLRSILKGTSAVVHVAGRAHIFRDNSPDPLADFRKVNVEATINLARQSAEAGVRRFVFISSIGVNGAETFETPFRSDSEVAPHSIYALTKYEAEVALRSVAKETGMEIVIIRPPLVYGPNAPGNFGILLKFVKCGWPLPLGAATNNKRSFVALGNLVDLILKCVEHPKAAHRVFLASDGDDLSTVELLNRIGFAFGKPVRLINMPLSALKFATKICGRDSVAKSLFGSLQVDIGETCSLLDWKPVLSVNEALRIVARAVA